MFLLLSTLLAASTPDVVVTPSLQTETYEWQSVPITGGGFVPGIILSPNTPDVRYCRTDMGGAYRWDAASGSWQQLLDWLPYDQSYLQGVESIAIDPNDPNHVLMACGTNTGTPGAILVSHDGFRSCRRTDVPFGFGGNENGRGNGERMMISPLHPNEAYLGTRNDGLWHTLDDGLTWQKVTTFPTFSEPLRTPQDYWNRGAGVVCTLFDGSDVYVAVSVKDQNSLWCSHDQGATWQPVAGQPTQWRPTHLVLSSDRKLYVSYGDTPGPSQMNDGAVYAYDIASGRWSDITPLQAPKGSTTLGCGFAAVAVDAQHPQTLIASTHSLWGKYGYIDEELFFTQDGGRHWTPIFRHGYRYDCTAAPYAEMAPLHWMFDVEIDPFNPEHAMVTTGFGGWETFNLHDCLKKKGVVVWEIMAKGVEETVPLEMYCPPTGARLMVGVGDYGGFTFDDITRHVPTGSNFAPHFANTDGITGAWHRPELAVRVGEVFHGRPDQRPVSYSTDGGHHWVECDTRPTERSRNGHIAVSALGTSWIWTPNREDAYRTTDCGATWTPCQGLPRNIRCIADRENDQRFYAVDVVGRKLYSSFDGGATFVTDSLALCGEAPRMRDRGMSRSRGDSRGGQDRVYATPGHEGDLWIAAYDGLYHLVTPDSSLHTPHSSLLIPHSLTQVRTIYAFGFGKGLTPDYPSLYLIGIVNGVYGIFRSDDHGTSWIKINDDQHQYGHLLHIIGDMQQHGRVYIGTHGRGVITGSPIQ